MTFQKWVKLFFTTLGIGALAGIVMGFTIGAIDGEFAGLGWDGFGFNISTMILAGLMFSIISQMGFFAYLTINYIAMSIMRKRLLWQYIQIAGIVIVLFDLAYLPYIYFGTEGQNILHFSLLPLLLLAASLIVGYFKTKATNSSAWVPTIFFISVWTTIEAIPSLKENNMTAILFMVVPLLCCNIWQIMQLHRISTPAAQKTAQKVGKS